MAEKKVFVRKATGLVREIGFLTAILIVACNMIGLGWQKRLFQFTGKAIVPENSYVLGLPPIVMAFILVGVVVLFTVWIFAILGAAMPRSGGGYVYISRIIHPAVGYAGSVLEYWSIAVSYGLIGTAVFEAITIYAWMAGWGTGWATPEVLLVGGMVIVVLFAALASFGVRMAGMLLQIIFWIPAAITIILYGVLLTSTPNIMTTGIESVTGMLPAEFTNMALGQGMATAFTGDYWAAVDVAILGAYWAYIGFAASTFVAGEIKEVAKNLPRTLFVANGFVILLYITISYVSANAARMVGSVTTGGNTFTFFSAYAYMSYGGGTLPADVGKAWMPNIAGFAANGAGLNWFLALIPIFAALWVANDIPPFILTSSRIIFAMAFDRVLPEKLAEVNERWHTPIYAVLVTVLVAFVGNFAESNVFVDAKSSLYLGAGNIVGTFLNADVGVVATDIWDVLFFLLASVAGLLFVFRKKGIYDKSAYKPSIGGLQLVTAVGLIATATNIWLLWRIALGWPWDYPTMYDPAVGGGTWSAWIMTLVIVIVALILYYYYKSKGSRIGVDYSTIYAEIPPE